MFLSCLRASTKLRIFKSLTCFSLLICIIEKILKYIFSGHKKLNLNVCNAKLSSILNKLQLDTYRLF